MSDLTPSPSVPEPANAPPRIPYHELLHRVGRGAYGEVWLARGVTGSFRAVKIVRAMVEAEATGGIVRVR